MGGLEVGDPRSLRFLGGTAGFCGLVVVCHYTVQRVRAGLRILSSRFSIRGGQGPVSFVGAEVGRPGDVCSGLRGVKCRFAARGVRACLGSMTNIQVIYTFVSSVCVVSSLVARRSSVGIVRVGSCVGGPGSGNCQDCRVVIRVPMFFTGNGAPVHMRLRVQAGNVSF